MLETKKEWKGWRIGKHSKTGFGQQKVHKGRAMRASGWSKSAQATSEEQRREERKADEGRKDKCDGLILDTL